MNDPLDPLKKIQQHLDMLKRIQQIQNLPSVTSPHIDASKLKIQFNAPGGPVTSPALLPAMPDPLVEWLLEDLSPRAFHDLVAETAALQKAKGYRPGHVPRAEGLKLLKKRCEKDPAFRARAGGLWLQGRRKEEDAFRLLKPADVRRDPWSAVERFGFPMAVWLMTLSSGGALRMSALQVIKEVTAKSGRLEEALAEAAKRAPEKMWSLPDVSHGDEIARIQEEVALILAERDRAQADARAEKEKREKADEELKRLRDEGQRLGHAKSAAEQARRALEEKVRELEGHLAALRGGETAMKRLEKQLKESEHERGRLEAGRRERESAEAALREDRDRLARALRESEATARHLARILSGAGKSFRGRTVGLVQGGPAGDYFDAARRAEVTLLLHDGRAKNAAFEKFLAQAERVFVLGEPGAFHEAVSRALRDEPRAVWLPPLDAARFEILLRAAADL